MRCMYTYLYKKQVDFGFSRWGSEGEGGGVYYDKERFFGGGERDFGGFWRRDWEGGGLGGGVW